MSNGTNGTNGTNYQHIKPIVGDDSIAVLLSKIEAFNVQVGAVQAAAKKASDMATLTLGFVTVAEKALALVTQIVADHRSRLDQETSNRTTTLEQRIQQAAAALRSTSTILDPSGLKIGSIIGGIAGLT